MQCYFCNKSLNLYIENYNACEKCIHCKVLYVKNKNIDSYIKIFLYNNFDITYKYTALINEKLKEQLSLIKNIKNKVCKNYSCKLANNCNRKKCTIFQYKINNFKYWYCTYAEYFVFSENDLKKYLKQFIFKVKLKYNLEILRNKVKALFIKEE